MVPACKDLGVMAVCGQKVAPSTLTPCHLHDGAGAHSVCGGGTGFPVRTGSHGSHPQGSSGLAGCSALFQDNPEIAESCLCDGHSELRWVEGSVEGCLAALGFGRLIVYLKAKCETPLKLP